MKAHYTGSTNRSIRARLWLAAALPAVLAIFALLLLFLGRYSADLSQAWQDRARVAALQLAGSSEFPLFANDQESLQRLVDATHRGDAQLRAAAIFTEAGRQVVIAGNLSAPSPVFDSQERVLLDTNVTAIVPIRPTALTGRDDLFQETPPADGVTLRGYAVIQMSLDGLRERRTELIVMVLAATAGVLALAALLSTAIASSVTRPIRHISEVVAQIERGRMESRADVRRSGALAELAQGINTMAARVGLTQEELRHQVSLATAELRQQKEAAEQAARLDPLTHVLGRRGFTEAAEQEIQRCLRYHHPLSLIMIDIDHFKTINDTHGHAAGDAVLVGFAQLLTSEVREWDVVGRLGGEEFAVLLPSSGADQAVAVAERMRASVRNAQASVRGQPLQYSASFGVAEFQPRELTLDSLLARADAALYAAKRAGRDRVLLAPPQA